MADIPLGYYVHHHGVGHLIRALQITQNMERPVYLFSSRAPHVSLPSNVHFISMSEDVVDNHIQANDSYYHYTPWSDKLFNRTRVYIDAIQKYKIKHMYVDVSAEIVHLSKLLGLQVGSAVMHGLRTDTAHTYMYNDADYLLCHQNETFDIPTNRSTATLVEYSGGISRYAKRLTKPVTDIKSVLVVSSRNNAEYNIESLNELARSNPQINWNIIGPTTGRNRENITFHGIIDDYSDLADTADLIIGSGGNNTIMEAASFGKPFICIPENRPYDEQLEAAKLLVRMNAAVHLDQLPRPEQWADIVSKVSELNLDAFSSICDDNGAKKAAHIIERHLF